MLAAGFYSVILDYVVCLFFFLLQHELLICPVYGNKIYSPSLA